MDNITYKRSLPVRVVKVCLEAAYRFLPKGVYNLLYGILRRVLWVAQRISLRIKFLSASAFNKKERGKLFLVDKLLPYTMGGTLALSSTFDIIVTAEKEGIEGDLVECGVAKGGCGAMMALASKELGSNRKLWLFDSYEGLPDPTEKDFRDGKVGKMIGPISRGMLVGTVEQIKTLIFNKCLIAEENVRIVKGWFDDTLPVSKNLIDKIAVLRLDGDWYESTKCCLDNLYDKVTANGFVIVDDYATCYGAERAIIEFLNKRNVRVMFMPDGRGGAWFRKPA